MDEKKEKVEVKVQPKTDVDTKAIKNLEKQMANIAFTLRKMKDWLESKLGADIDGDGRIGGGPYKKILAFIIGLGLAVSVQALPANTNIEVWVTGATYIDGSGNIIAPIFSGQISTTNLSLTGDADVGGAFTIGETLGVTGKTTLGDEVEINGAAGVAIDVNLVTNANLITIDQTAAAGPGSKPLIDVTDARTGTSADAAAEATVLITAAGAYGLSVADGIVNIEGEIDSTGDITLDPAGDDVIIDGTVDATAYTADAGSGIDAKTAGALDLGNTVATSIDYGSAAVTAHTFTSDGVGTAEFVVPNASIGATEIALAEGEMLFGFSGTGVAAVVSGDVLIPRTGIAVIQDLAVEDSNIALTDAYLIVGNTGTGSEVAVSGDLTMSNLGAFTVDEINSIAVATVTAGAALGDTSAQKTEVWGKPSMVSGVIATTNGVVAVQALYLDGSANSDYRLMHFWITDTLGGAASTNNIEAFTLANGTLVEEVTANSDYKYVTASTGTNTITIDVQGADTHYLYGSDGSSVTNIEMIFAGP